MVRATTARQARQVVNNHQASYARKSLYSHAWLQRILGSGVPGLIREK
jgi:hypothetical protein